MPSLLSFLAGATTVALLATPALAQETAPATPEPMTAQPAPPEPAPPEPETFFGGDVHYGGWGGIAFLAGAIHNQPAVWTRFMGGFQIGRTITIGMGGMALSNLVPGDDDVQAYYEARGTTNRQYLTGGIGGLLIAVDFLPLQAIHPYAHVLVGAGGFSFNNRSLHHSQLDQDEELEAHYRLSEATAAFAANAEAGVTFNLTRWMRADIVGGTVVTAGIELADLDDSDLLSFHGGLQLRFGRF